MRVDMRTLTLLLVLLGAAPVLAADAQEADAPEGSLIEAAEVSGLPLDQLSPGLRQDIEALAGTPLNRERVGELAARIEAEQPEFVAAVRSVPRPDGKARVIFLIARISDDRDLVSNINARYTVESVEICGIPETEISQPLRDRLQALVGGRLDHDEAERLDDLLAAERPGYDVKRRISRGSEPGRIRVVFEFNESEGTRWIPFTPSRSKFVYHSDQGWSGVLDVPMGDSHHRFTAGFVFSNKDDLIEEYSGYRLRFESRTLATNRLGASLEFARFNQSWDDATLSALASDPGIPGAYRTRLTVEPSVTFAFNPSLRVTAGVSVSELESLAQSPSSQMANVVVAGISANHRWTQSSDAGQKVSASYQLRAATDALESDLVYKRHFGQARYQYDRGSSTVMAAVALGYITGRAPLFERFSLGDSATLRGWSKFDVAPAGGDRMFHQSLEYRYHQVAWFFDTGSVWERGTNSRIRSSTGFGIHGDNAFLTLGFPLKADDVGATFMMGVRF